jgi:hypothetical protein
MVVFTTGGWEAGVGMPSRTTSSRCGTSPGKTSRGNMHITYQITMQDREGICCSRSDEASCILEMMGLTGRLT